MALDLYPLVWPVLRRIDPERSHGLALSALKRGWVPSSGTVSDPVLKTHVFGLDFPNPVGLAAGFDKDAEVPDIMLGHGFGFVEVGSITPKAQPGNDKPRLFRLTEDGAVINRMGFNNHGIEAAKPRLEKRAGNGGVVGVNLGKNKTTEVAEDDYRAGVAALGPFASYLVINVSSPNTPGLRALQGRDALAQLLSAVLAERDQLTNRPPLLLKVAPDLTDEDKADIAAVAIASKIDGLIVTNTTIDRPRTLLSAQASETGGLSGKPLFQPSTEVLRELYALCDGKMPIIGVGGIASGADAYAKIRAGASLVQLYSALVYNGFGLVNRINRDLIGLLKRDGFERLADAVGADHR